jgi:hypothetical protein
MSWTARDPIEVWCEGSRLLLRDGLERKLWGDVFGAFDAQHRRNMSDTPRRAAERAADEAVILMRLRQGTVWKSGRDIDGHPIEYRVCAVCTERYAHQERCPNDMTPLTLLPEVK